MKIGIDLDGVLADFIGGFRPICKEVSGKPCEGDQGSWDFSNWGLTKQERRKAWEQACKVFNFHLSLKPLPDVLRGHLEQFSHEHTLFFLTSRVKTPGFSVEKQTAAWLVRHLYVEYPTVIVGPHKGELAAALRLDAFIDDKPKNLYDVATQSSRTKLYVRDQTYNQDLLVPATRVYNFGEFIESVTKNAALV